MNFLNFQTVPIQRNFCSLPVYDLRSLVSCLLNRSNVVSIFRPESDVSLQDIPINDVSNPLGFKNLLPKFTISQPFLFLMAVC
jgi:hypothetical protein